MDAASTAFNKILHRSAKEGGGGGGEREGGRGDEAQEISPSGQTDTTSHQQTTARPVEHETIQRQHQHREQKVVDKERHQDHYKTTVQPLKEREVRPEQHSHEQADTRHEHHNHTRERDAKRMVHRQQAQFKDETREGGMAREVVREPTLTSEHVHHHLHETIQPVIEKETVVPSVTHKTVPVKEVHQDPTIDEGITTNAPISKEEFEERLKK
ncbi:hypothetical protein GGS21DRAFT_147200 [Xylaria nigripes]|nr:hypothetical protein GGS21DRAFT_147200 [Xylaria nigripes]